MPTASPSTPTAVRRATDAGAPSACRSGRPRSMNIAAASMTTANSVSWACPLKNVDRRAPA